MARARRAGRAVIPLFDHEVFLAQPRAAYDGAVPAGFEPTAQVYVAHHELEARAADVVKGLVTSRRRSFRWCVCCRRVNAPEDMYGDRCGHCAMVVN